MRKALFAMLIIAGMVAAAGFGYFVTARSDEQRPGQALYLANCASCHGANLEGQPDWMRRKPDGRLPAPPHDASGHTWHHSDRQLFQIVKDGLASIAPGYETDMPAFAGVLNDGEIHAVLEYIKGTWPERQQAVQEARSKAEAD